jgi:hypothetical protein
MTSGKLTVEELKKLIPTTKSSHPIVSIVSLDTLLKFITRNKFHDLGKYIFA